MDPKAKAAALRRARARLRAGRIGRRLLTRVHPEMTSTTGELPGYTVARTLGVVTAEIVRVGDLFSNLAVNWQDGAFGGRSKALEDILTTTREECLAELRLRAWKCGAGAIIGLRVDVELPTKSVIVAQGMGTAVCVVANSTDVAPEQIGAPEDGEDQPADIDEKDLLRCHACGSGLVVAEEGADPSCPACGGAAFSVDDGRGPDPVPPHS